MKITVAGYPMVTTGDAMKFGDKLTFRGVTQDNKKFNSKKIKGVKVISIFPTINTPICDGQTKHMMAIASKYDKVTFISVSLDTVEDLSKWCGHEYDSESFVVSDLKYKDVSKKTGFRIHGTDLMHRAFIVLDRDDRVVELIFNHDLDKKLDYRKLDKAIAKQYDTF